MDSRLEVDEYDYRNERMAALYTEHPYDLPPGLVVRPDLLEEDLDAILMEADSYACRRSPRGGRKFMHEPESIEGMDRERLAAYRRVVEKERPDWVERVRWAAQIDNRPEKIISYSGVPPYPAYAILLNLQARGELPSDDWGAS